MTWAQETVQPAISSVCQEEVCLEMHPGARWGDRVHAATQATESHGGVKVSFDSITS